MWGKDFRLLIPLNATLEQMMIFVVKLWAVRSLVNDFIGSVMTDSDFHFCPYFQWKCLKRNATHYFFHSGRPNTGVSSCHSLRWAETSQEISLSLLFVNTALLPVCEQVLGPLDRVPQNPSLLCTHSFSVKTSPLHIRKASTCTSRQWQSWCKTGLHLLFHWLAS